MGNAIWDLAGLTGPDSLLGRSIRGGAILVPSVVRRAKETLYWEMREPHLIDAPRGLVDSFIALRDADDDAIAEFASRYGVLAILDRGAWRRGIERFGYWRAISRRFWATIELAALAQAGKVASASVLEVFCGTDFPKEEYSMEHRLFGAGDTVPVWRSVEKPNIAQIVYYGHPSHEDLSFWKKHGIEIVAQEVSHWMEVGGVSLAVSVQNGTWDLAVSFHGRLLGALAMQLALAVSRSDVPFTCSECGEVYIRGRDPGKQRKRRSPNPGCENFCPRCGRKAAVRAADERRRKAIGEARRLYREDGLSAKVIAKRLGKDLSLVERWIEKGK